MKALSALRQVFSLKKNEELGRKFSPEELKRIVDAMKEYAASSCRSSEPFVSVNLSWPMTPAKEFGDEPAITELYVLQSLKKRVKPLNLIDYGKRQTVIHVFGRCWRKCLVLTGTV